MMVCSSTTMCLLFLFLDTPSVEAAIFLVESRPEHEGSVAIVGGNKRCRTVGEAALRCELTDDCRGMWFYRNGTGDNCQAARCPSSPGTMNPVPGQSRFFFLSTITLIRGNSITQNEYSVSLFLKQCDAFSYDDE